MDLLHINDDNRLLIGGNRILSILAVTITKKDKFKTFITQNRFLLFAVSFVPLHLDNIGQLLALKV